MKTEDDFKSGGALAGCLVGFGLTILAVLAVYVVMIVLSAVHKYY